MNIDWQSQESHILLNPRLPIQDALRWQTIPNLTQEFSAHIWLTTSGSMQAKLVALHKNAILASAQAVNQHLQASAKDVWINPLPIFHVGGLGICARAHLSGAAIYSFSEKWCPHRFQKMVSEKQGTLTSLVPTQVYDLVINRLAAPKSLRALIVGGGALQEPLYKEARELGWPLLSSYGMTECSSQIATSALNSLLEDSFPAMAVLPHVRVKIEENDRICISSPALLSAYASIEQDKICFSYPVTDGWYTSQDRGALVEVVEKPRSFATNSVGPFLKLFGRIGDFIKIGGESVEMGGLEKILEEIKLQQRVSFDVVLAAVPDSRLGHAIHLFSTDTQIEALQRQYDSQVMPYERIRKVHIVPLIPRSPLNKVLKNELIKLDRKPGVRSQEPED